MFLGKHQELAIPNETTSITKLVQCDYTLIFTHFMLELWKVIWIEYSSIAYVCYYPLCCVYVHQLLVFWILLLVLFTVLLLSLLRKGNVMYHQRHFYPIALSYMLSCIAHVLCNDQYTVFSERTHAC